MERLYFKSVVGDEKPSENIKISESKKRGKKVSLAVRVDDGFIFNLAQNKDSIGAFIGLEVDATSKVMTLQFEKID